MPNPSVRHFGFKKVVNLSQDVRFKDKQKKLYKNLVVHKNIKSIPKRAVDIKKVNMEVIKEWITKKLRQLLGFDDEIVMDYLVNQLEEKQFPDPKEVQINITGFINGKNAKEFVGELWPLLMSATENGTGIPQAILDAKKKEIASRHEEPAIDDTQPGPSKSSSSQPIKQIQISETAPGTIGELRKSRPAATTNAIEILDSDSDEVQAPVEEKPQPVKKVGVVRPKKLSSEIQCLDTDSEDEKPASPKSTAVVEKQPESELIGEDVETVETKKLVEYAESVNQVEEEKDEFVEADNDQPETLNNSVDNIKSKASADYDKIMAGMLKKKEPEPEVVEEKSSKQSKSSSKDRWRDRDHRRHRDRDDDRRRDRDRRSDWDRSERKKKKRKKEKRKRRYSSSSSSSSD